MFITPLQGEVAFFTECSHCRTKSKQYSKFYELQLSLKGHATVKDCLRHYFRAEVIDWAAFYICQTTCILGYHVPLCAENGGRE
jgi:hypothetical protein